MRNLPTAEEARQWLTVQLEILNELRTESARNPAFKQWRNNTLGLAERIWPHQPTKYKRFRRIPFQPSSARANDRATRESFEKGCAEARRQLQLWIAEINLHGLLHAGEGGTLDPMPDLGDAPASEAPGSGSRMLGRGGSMGRPGAPDTGHVPGAGAPGTGHVPRGHAFGVGSGGRGPAKAPPKKSKPRLKDMLGLGGGEDESAAAPPHVEPPRVEPPPKPAIPLLREPAQPLSTPPPGGEFTIERMERPSPRDTGPDVLERSIFAAMQRAMTEAVPELPAAGAEVAKETEVTAEPPGMEATPEASPAEAVAEPPKIESIAAAPESEAREALTFPQPIPEPAATTPAAPVADPASERSDVVVEIVRLASDLDLLGVPESDKRAVRAALLEVGRTLDSDAPAWDAFQEAIARGIRYPALARRLLPLLTPFLDTAA